MLISLPNLAAMGKIQKNVLTKVRPVPPFMKVIYAESHNKPANNFSLQDCHISDQGECLIWRAARLVGQKEKREKYVSAYSLDASLDTF